MKKYRESIMKVVFLVAACVSILAVVLICGFLFVNGFPAIAEIGPLKFLTGVIWKPQEGEFGHSPHDYRQHLCHRYRYSGGGAHRAACVPSLWRDSARKSCIRS